MIEFITEKAKYVYDPKLIGVQQARVAQEILQFKYEQHQRQPETWDAVEKSGGVDWFVNCAAALITKIDGEKAVDFNIISWSAAKDFVRRLPYLESIKLQECMTDFFCSIQKEPMLSEILAPKSQKLTDKILSQLVAETLKTKSGAMTT